MHKRISLHGEWQFQEVGSDTWKRGAVPGCVQLDLLKLGEVPDPFYRLNEIEMYKLEEKEWLYRKTFELRAGDLTASRLNLVFEGIDTCADVYLNGVWLGAAVDMFIPYVFDITHLAREGENIVEVRLHSPLTTIKAEERNSPVRLASSCESARPYIRKAQYSYGWDWGPRIAQVGLWRPVYIEAIREARVVDPFLYTDKLGEGSARVRVTAEVESYTAEPLQAQVNVYYRGVSASMAQVPVVNVKGKLAIEATLDIENPRLWWPNGYGDQPLYDVKIALMGEGAVLDECAFKSGLRTVRLIQEADVEGRSFIVEINGVRVFCKGANWIPADNLLPRLTKQDYDDYIRLAQEAHMNMLRIWGGGIYEDPAFFEACDERGVMVWHDFMYACAQYPDEFDWFQKLARIEAEAVVKALRNHPSLVLWCGNNENNWGFDEWWHNGVPKYLGNYVYREILPQVCAELDPSRPYWVSSPYGGEHPNGMDEGDRHSWTVWSNWRDYSGYLSDTGRFISEFGFQAMPNWKTVLSYTAPEDRSILNPVIIGHNKMTEGTERLIRFLVGRVGLPKDLQSFVYLTQFNQAEAIKLGVEFWRGRKFMTSGALYWQINDCWPVASWACLDYYKRKKGLYYATKRFFAPILPVLRYQEGGISLQVINDHLEELSGEAKVTAYALDGRKRGEARFPVTLAANTATNAKRLSLADLGIGYSPRVLPVDGQSTTNPREHNGELLDTVVFVELTVGDKTYTNTLVFERYRTLALQPANIQVAVQGKQITLCSTVPAFGVFIEPEADVDLSDNCLTLEPGVPVTITCSDAPGAVQVFDLTTMTL